MGNKWVGRFVRFERPSRAMLFGLAGTLGLAALYLGVAGLAESWPHALQLFQEDAPWVVPIMLGFGVQVGLYAYLKRGGPNSQGAHVGRAVTGASGGTSGVTMLACCAHHLTDLLPLLGLSAASAFLTTYKPWLLALGLAGNVVGIVMMLRLLCQQRQQVPAPLIIQEGCHS